MLVRVPKTLTDAINSQPARVQLLGLHGTMSSVRQVPYSEVYRESTSVRETPVARLQRITSVDSGGARQDS